MNFLRKIYYFFSQYTGPEERRVGKFFARVNEKHSPHSLERSLRDLLQDNIAVINLWTERRYKGYNYLTKAERKRLYDNLELIKKDFDQYAAQNKALVNTSQVLAVIAKKGCDIARLRTFPDQLTHLVLIMRYLSPHRGLYVYRESSSFGRLLKDPAQSQLVGDCNQIVTLYLALYATKYDITDLKLTLYPGHVALHFYGVDIEATSGQFANYSKEGLHRENVQEIVSVNLLDVTDSHFTKSDISPDVYLQAARLAYAVSSNRQLVKRNLEIAYHNTVRHLMKQGNYKSALDYARQSKDYELIQVAASSGAIAALKQRNYREARALAGFSSRKNELIAIIDKNEAASHYNAKRYQEARQIYERLGEREMVRQCYRGLYLQEQSKMGKIKTVADVKANAGTIRNMEKYARASGDSGLMKHAQSLVKYL